MKKNPFAMCSFNECEHKSECKRFTDDKEVQVIRFENLIEDECEWFIKKNLPKE